jgi:L-amino acid N-acyltransferase YncA
MSPTLRLAQLSDLPTILDIYNVTIPGRQATADLEPVTLESRRPWFEQHDPTSRPLWVAEVDGEIVGWLSFETFYGRPAYDATAEISIYIAPTHQHQGIGRWLLKEAIVQGSDFGLKTLLAFIFAHNVPSLRLFECCGFREWGNLLRVAELDRVERDLIIMGRRIV